MKIFPLCLLASALLITGCGVQAAPATQGAAWKPTAVVPNVTMTGKVMTGYQGWFNAEGDGAQRGWHHWGGNPPGPGEATVDMWPDMSETEPDERFPTNFKYKDGRVAELFSSFNEKTELRHFKWMRDYGLDGVFMQRFVGEISNPSGQNHFNKVLQTARKGAKEYGRVYGVMYDLSGMRDGGGDVLINDWKGLVDSMHLTQDERYVRHNKKPVVVLWGLGFGGDRPPLFEDGLKIVNFLKNDPVYGGNTVMLGVPYQWRTTDTEQVPFAKMQQLVMAADIVSPWAVGTTGDPKGSIWNAEHVLKPDLAWCKAHGKEYMPVVFPGFGWYNLRKGRAPSNQIPRLGGKFLWTQYVEAKKAGATMVYQAMFDEVDEGTAIFKVSNEVPDGGGKSQFVPLEGLPSDFYLKLVGQGTRLVRGEIKPEDDTLVKNAKWTPFVPELPVLPPADRRQATDVAAPKLGRDGYLNEGFWNDHNAYLRRIKEGPIGLLFIGDSITNRWRNSDALWQQRYGAYNPANFGIEGDQTQHVLWRFENGELDGINPKVVVVMIGTNNMDYPAEEIIKGDQKIVAEIHRRLPDTKVLLLGIFPRGAPRTDGARAKIKGINVELAKLDDGNKTRFLDFGDKFLEADGTISQEMMPDALHPAAKGYQIWADAMQPLLDEMMR